MESKSSDLHCTVGILLKNPQSDPFEEPQGEGEPRLCLDFSYLRRGKKKEKEFRFLLNTPVPETDVLVNILGSQ
ncbi:hypothetical protein Csa_014280 [Cucumis sativus]|uniref:Uncharacterized protein n=1 Tax=Cucumis sativus TaxID=3659 RepID=A0A0A0LUP0_CUCSA|nr:hypothetical protein Csa_014280 [Cucumis sativus]